MASDQNQILKQATQRVMGMRKEKVSRAKIAEELGVSPDVIMTIERLGAGKTRRIARGRILRWMAKGGSTVSAASAGSSTGSSAPTRRRRRRRRGGRPAAGTQHTSSPAASGGATFATVDVNGTTVRLRAGRRYMLRGTTLYEALGE